jgi:predicted GNAT superfamily acetyltransferase
MTDEVLFVTASDANRAEPLGQAVLALNNAHARELSWLEPERLEHLIELRFCFGELESLTRF